MAGRRQSFHVEDCGRRRRTVGRNAVTLPFPYGALTTKLQGSTQLLQGFSAIRLEMRFRKHFSENCKIFVVHRYIFLVNAQIFCASFVLVETHQCLSAVFYPLRNLQNSLQTILHGPHPQTPIYECIYDQERSDHAK